MTYVNLYFKLYDMNDIIGFLFYFVTYIKVYERTFKEF